MSAIESYIIGIDDPVARAALYYVGRYVKQAKYFEEYGKDIFDEEERSAPSEEVKNLARAIISAIEAREGSAASKFGMETIIRILDEITALEESLGSEMSEVVSTKVDEFLDSLQVPAAKK